MQCTSRLKAESLVFLSHFLMFYEGKLAAEAPGAGPGHGAGSNPGRGASAGGFCPNLTPLRGSGQGTHNQDKSGFKFTIIKSSCNSDSCLWFNISNDIQSALVSWSGRAHYGVNTGLRGSAAGMSPRPLTYLSFDSMTALGARGGGSF